LWAAVAWLRCKSFIINLLDPILAASRLPWQEGLTGGKEPAVPDLSVKFRSEYKEFEGYAGIREAVLRNGARMKEPEYWKGSGQWLVAGGQ